MMQCHDVQPLLHLYADGELDALTTMELDRHFSQCESCSQRRRGIEALRGIFQAEGLYERAPASLSTRIEASLDAAAGGRLAPIHMLARWLPLAAAVFLVAGVAGWLVLQRSQVTNSLARELVASHVRSTLAHHLVDVASSDQHTVKPWFQGKLDYSVEAKDFAADGFALEGGRLDYLDGRPVAALVYRHAKHPINLFIWPAQTAGGTSRKDLELQGYHVIGWTQRGMQYWAVSNLNDVELKQFVEKVRSGE